MKIFENFTMALIITTVILIVGNLFIPIYPGVLFLMSATSAILTFLCWAKNSEKFSIFTWAIWIPTTILWLLFWIIRK